MIVNKSSGQSLDQVGVDLRTPPFSHGQLHGPLSRVTLLEGLLLPPLEQSSIETDKVVYPKVLL